MRRVRERQLARVAAGAKAADDAAAWHQAALRARVKVGAVLRQALAQLQIDPATVPMLRFCDEAEQELAMMMPGSKDAAAPAVPACEPRGDGSVTSLAGRLDTMVRRHRGENKIDLTRASLAELLGWCSTRRD